MHTPLNPPQASPVFPSYADQIRRDVRRAFANAQPDEEGWVPRAEILYQLRPYYGADAIRRVITALVQSGDLESEWRKTGGPGRPALLLRQKNREPQPPRFAPLQVIK